MTRNAEAMREFCACAAIDPDRSAFSAMCLPEQFQFSGRSCLTANFRSETGDDKPIPKDRNVSRAKNVQNAASGRRTRL
jgi:hypothetical protein